MKTTVLLPAALMLTAGLCAAQEVGRVISSTPVFQQVTQPRQVCTTETVATPSQRSGAGAALGAIAGGALGNAVGQGNGRAVATMLGLFGGAVLGDRVEGQGAPQYQNQQRCTTQTVWENRTSHFNVVYEYGGKQYAVQLPRDPGPTLNLQVTPLDALPPPPAPSMHYLPPGQPQTFYTQPNFVAMVPPPLPAYYVRPYNPPIGANPNDGYTHGQYWRHRNHDGSWR